MYVHEWYCPGCKQSYGFRSYIDHPGQPKMCRRCSQQVKRPVWTVLKGTVVVEDEVLSNYKRQLIVQFSNTENDGPIKAAGTALNNRAKFKRLESEIIVLSTKEDNISEENKKKFGALEGGRLYLIGHGQADKIHGTGAFELAYRLCANWGLKSVKRISLVSCGTAEEGVILGFAETFAQTVSKCRVGTQVVAYTKSISVAPLEYAKKYNNPYLEGQKAYYEGDKLYFIKSQRGKVKKYF